MSSRNGHYDQDLLAAAPAATKAEMQEGYNVDLLHQGKPRRSQTTTPPIVLPPSRHSTDPEFAQAKETYVPPARASRPSFWRSKKGAITIAVIAIVAIAAVVGGAVGGTQAKKKPEQDNSGVPSTSSSSGQLGAGTGAVSETGPSTTRSSTSGNTQSVASGTPGQSTAPQTGPAGPSTTVAGQEPSVSQVTN